MVTSRFLFNIGKTSSVLLAATLFISGFSASQAEAAVNAATTVQEASSPNQQLIARKPRKKVIKTKGRRTVIKKQTTIISPSSTTVIKESTVVTPTQPTESAPPPPRVEPSVVQPQTQVERDEPVSQQDLDRLRGLVDSYRTELEGVDTRIKEANAKTAKAGFSTTTKLVGEVVIAVSGYGGVPGSIVGGDKGTILSDRVRLNFDTSFTGQDRLRTRLQSRNTNSFNGSTTPGLGVTGTNQTRLGFDGSETNGTSVALLQYGFPLNDSTRVIAEATGSKTYDNINNFNPLLASSANGAISRFGRFSPIYRLADDGAGLTIKNKISDNLELSLAYAVPGLGASGVANVPSQTSGLFNGSNVALAQLAFKPSDDLSLGFTYARSYHTNGGNLAGGTGSSGSNIRTPGVGAGFGANSPFNTARTSANHYSFQASYKLGTSAVLSGWYGFTEANAEGTPGAAAGTAGVVGGTASTSNWAATLALPDFASKGNVLSFIVGQSPKLNALTVGGVGQTVDSASSLHLEALYKVKVSDNIDITPGLLLITNPENNAANGTEYVGTVRTTFRF